jgi:hypothetical protein
MTAIKTSLFLKKLLGSIFGFVSVALGLSGSQDLRFYTLYAPIGILISSVLIERGRSDYLLRNLASEYDLIVIENRIKILYATSAISLLTMIMLPMPAPLFVLLLLMFQSLMQPYINMMLKQSILLSQDLKLLVEYQLITACLICSSIIVIILSPFENLGWLMLGLAPGGYPILLILSGDGLVSKYYKNKTIGNIELLFQDLPRFNRLAFFIQNIPLITYALTLILEIPFPMISTPARMGLFLSSLTMLVLMKDSTVKINKTRSTLVYFIVIFICSLCVTLMTRLLSTEYSYIELSSALASVAISLVMPSLVVSLLATFSVILYKTSVEKL